MTRVYAELRAIAHRELARHRPSATLGTTALVNEAYLKLAARSGVSWTDRGHFLCVAALAMRHVLVDYARRRRAQKRGAGITISVPAEWHGASAAGEGEAASILALDAALTKLAAVDSRLARVVELRFFGGLSVEETASVLDVSPITIKRDTRAARAFLTREMEHADAPVSR